MNKKYLYIYLIVLFVLNSAQSVFVELSYDEAYYWFYSQFLSWGYYDHPPMVAWLIKLGTLFGHNEFAIRFPFNILTCSSLFLMWKITEQNNIKSFIAITSSLVLIQASGFLALPDTGLLFFSTLFLYFVKKYLSDDSTKNVFGLILSITLLFYSKYHGLAVVIFTTLGNLSFLKRKSFWLTVGAVIILYMPHMYWQYTQDFVTFKFHLFGRGEKVFYIKNILNYLTSQFVLFGMFNFFILCWLLKKVEFKDKWEQILVYNVFGFLALLTVVSFRNQIEANWTVTATMASVPLFLILLTRSEKYNKAVKILALIPLILIISLRIALFLPYSFYEERSIDRLNEVKGWDKRIDSIKAIVGDDFLISDTYQIAAKLSFYMKKFVPGLHLTSRDSHYNLVKDWLKDFDLDRKVFFLSPKLKENSVRIETGYKDPIYVHPTTIRKLVKRYNIDIKTLYKPNFDVLNKSKIEER